MDCRALSLNLVDSHCHLDFEEFDADQAVVLERANLAGLARIVNPGIDLPTSRAALRLAERHPEVYAAVGIHPNSAALYVSSESGNEWQDTLAELAEMAQHPKVVAIGEIGLDYYRDRTPRQLQQQAFADQLELAAKLGLPVIIHTRNATREDRRCQIDALIQLGAWVKNLQMTQPDLAKRPGVLHAFSGESETARQAIQLGLWLGIGGPLTFENAVALQKIIATVPLERLLIETDAPFLTPHPLRGQRNEPARTVLVAQKLAALHGLPLEVVARQTTANAAKLFNWRNLVD